MSTSKREQTEQDRDDAREHLRGVLGSPTTTINAGVVSATPEGTRKVQVYVASADGRVWDASIVVARAIGRRYSDPWRAPSGIPVRAVGLNAAHEVADALHRAVWGPDAREHFHFNEV